MIDDQTLANVWAPRLLAILRIVSALLFLEHGPADNTLKGIRGKRF
jgi:hypothetical protein